MELNGTTAVVTGAASGLGAATAAAFAKRGAQVFGFDLPDPIQRAEKADGVTLLPVDVTSAEDVERAFAEVEQSGTALRTVVNCAGIGSAARILSRGKVHDLGLFARVVTVNLIGTFNVLRLGADAMARTSALADDARGVIINTASVAAFDGQVGQVAYAASKGGAHSMTLSAARDLSQYGIRVNTIAPGIVDTPMLAQVPDDFRSALAASVPFPKRLATPTEYADLAVVLAVSDYINGETVRLDGALRMAPR